MSVFLIGSSGFLGQSIFKKCPNSLEILGSHFQNDQNSTVALDIREKNKMEGILINSKCEYYKKNLQNFISVKIKKNLQKIKKYSRAYIFFNEKNEILVRKRSSKGMLASMLEVPNDNWVLNKNKLSQDKIVQ